MHGDRMVSRPSPGRATDRVIAWGKKMLRSTTEPSRLYLTAELRAGDMQPKPAIKKPASPLFAADLKRFPPVEDVVAVLDRTARRAFIA